MIGKMDEFQIPEDYDALRRLYEQIRSENMHLTEIACRQWDTLHKRALTNSRHFLLKRRRKDPLKTHAWTPNPLTLSSQKRVRPTNASNCICRSLEVEGMYMPANGIAKRGKQDTVPPAGTNGFGANAASQRPDAQTAIILSICPLTIGQWHCICPGIRCLVCILCFRTEHANSWPSTLMTRVGKQIFAQLH